MVIIPNALKPAGAALEQLRVQRQHCTFYVLLAGDDGAQLASDADIRAENHPFRKVAWVTAPELLAQLPHNELLVQALAEDAAVCVATFDNRRSSVLKRGEKITLLTIEKAFIKAEVEA